MLSVQIFTDGACRGNPGPGGWGAIICFAKEEKLLRGGERLTTNNRMELMAPLMALRALKDPYEVLLTTDSQYVQKGMTTWLTGWKKRGWVTANKTPVKNSDLWQLLEQEAKRHQVTWQWTRGHSGHFYNEKADELANQAIVDMLSEAI